MRRLARSSILALLLTAPALSVVAVDGCTECVTAMIPDTADGIHPFFAIKNVTVLLDDDARAATRNSEHIDSRFDAERVKMAIQRWAGQADPERNLSKGACTGMPGIPSFTFDFEKSPKDRDIRSTILIDYVPGSSSGEQAGNRAELHARQEGTLIRLFGVCSGGSGACDKQNFFLWGSDYGEQVITHEVGHVLGIGHDKNKGEGCSKIGLMTDSSWSDTPLSILPEYCEMASKLNNFEETCASQGGALDGEIHPCQVCEYSLGGAVSGLDPGVVVELELFLPDINDSLYTSVFGSKNEYTFDEPIPDGFDYQLTAKPSDDNYTCTVANASGTVKGADISNVDLTCECTASEAPLTAGARTTAKNTACGPVDRGDLHDPHERPEPVLDLCQIFPSFCDGTSLLPWWLVRPGPGTGGEPCERETTCTDGGEECHTVPGMEEPVCGAVLNCHDKCAGGSTVKLTGPSVLIDGLDSTPASGMLRLTGFARDSDGLLDLWIYADGVKVSDSEIEMGLLRPEACSGVSGDCDPFSGFATELDTTSLSDGMHRLDIIALDAEPDYPMGTRIVRQVMVDNACSSTTLPAVSIVHPSHGDIVAGPVMVAAAASAEAGVERVQFYLDGVRVTTDWTAPYQWPWDTTLVADGSHQLYARAVDECGVGADSASIVVEAANANDPPRVELEKPIPGTQHAGIVEVSGWTLDEDGVESVSVRLNGQAVAPLSSEVRNRADVCSALGELDPRCPMIGWAVTFDSTLYPDGLYSLSAVAVDGRGGTASTSRQVEIGNQLPNPPGVTNPVSATAALGDTVSFQVTAWGPGPYSYQWQWRSGSRWTNLVDGGRGGRIGGAWSSTLTLTGLEFGDAGGYRSVVSNAGGSEASGSASLTVLATIAPPTVTSGIDQIVAEGGDANLTVSAEGLGPLAYRWQTWNGAAYVDLQNGSGLSGVSSPVLAVTGATLDHGGLYRCQVSNSGGTTNSQPIRLTVEPDLTGSCVSGTNTLCLFDNRFQVEAVMNGSPAKALPYSGLGGFFTLGNSANVEIAVKVLNGTYINGRYWVFHGAVTSQSYTVTVTDTVTGATKSYFKQAGSFCGVADTNAFTDPQASGGLRVTGMFVRLPAGDASMVGSCQSTTTAMCLLDQRFRVEVLRGTSPQRAVPVTNLSGAFTFGSTANPEVIVKVLDGTVVNDWYWVFFGSLTSQSYEVRVTDTTDGAVKTYPSPGTSCGGADTTAF